MNIVLLEYSWTASKSNSIRDEKLELRCRQSFSPCITNAVIDSFARALYCVATFVVLDVFHVCDGIFTEIKSVSNASHRRECGRPIIPLYRRVSARLRRK